MVLEEFMEGLCMSLEAIRQDATERQAMVQRGLRPPTLYTIRPAKRADADADEDTGAVPPDVPASERDNRHGVGKRLSSKGRRRRQQA